MAVLPAEIPTGLVTGHYYFVNEDNIDADTDPELTVVTGTVRFTASVKTLRMPSKKAVLVPLTFDGVFDSQGNLTPLNGTGVGMELPATNSPLFTEQDYTWRVEFNLKEAGTTNTVNLDSFDIQVPVGSTQDLSELIPVSSTAGVLTLRGPKGDDGPAGVVSDASVAAALEQPLTKAALSGTIEAGGASWIESRGIDVSSKPAPEDTPVITWTDTAASSFASPATYKPLICGTGAQVTGWDGRNDPNIAYFSGVFNTDDGANLDLGLTGSTKPGGAAAAARWPLVFAFNTTANAAEIYIFGYYAAQNIIVEVNGRLVSDTVFHRPLGTTIPAQVVKLTFPSRSLAPRQIRIWTDGSFGLAEIRVPTGETITKPTPLTGKRIAFIGDSYSNGSGESNEWPSQGTCNLETFVPRLLRMMGATDMVLAGIGGTGFVNGGDTRSYKTRISAVLSMSPDILIFLASINDDTAAGTIQAEVESALARVASVPRVYVIGTLLEGYAANRAAAKAGTLAAGRTFIDLGDFMHGSGRVTAPAGDGNNDYFRMADGAHPTLDAHRALARKAFAAISALG